MTSIEQALDNYLYFGGDLPNLAEGVAEVPMPDGFYICMNCHHVTDYWAPGGVCGGCEAKAELQMGAND